MKKSTFFLSVVINALFSASVHAQVTISPAEVELKNISQPVKIYVSHKGKPVLPSEITKIVSGVYKFRGDVPETSEDGKHFSNYSYMFNFVAGEDGSVIITANEDLVQQGLYDLYVYSIYGKATGAIRASLQEPDSETDTRRPNKVQFTYELALPDYKLGQEIVIKLNPDKINTYFWYVNGELHTYGLGETNFRMRPKTGIYEISLIAKDHEGDVVSTWSDTTQVSR